MYSATVTGRDSADLAATNYTTFLDLRNTLDNKVTASGRLTHVLDPEFDGVSNRAYPSWANNWLKNVTYDPATIPTEDAIEGLF